MKTFYTERDIEEMHAAGVTEIEINDDVVLTELAREKAIVLGLRMKRVEQGSGQAEAQGGPRPAASPQMPLPPAGPGPTTTASPPSSPTGIATTNAELVSRIKSAVIARLGTNEHSDLLDQIIPQVLARLGGPH